MLKLKDNFYKLHFTASRDCEKENKDEENEWSDEFIMVAPTLGAVDLRFGIETILAFLNLHIWYYSTMIKGKEKWVLWLNFLRRLYM